MTEEAKQAVIAKVKAMLDENERIRVVEARSLQSVFDSQNRREIRDGRERYLLIAVGDELETEKLSVRLLSSAINTKG